MTEQGNSLDCNNYRPVSLTSNLSKLIEKLVHKRLCNFLEKHKLLYEHQYGFQKKHSTYHALIDITEKIRSALDQNIFARGIFIDLQKAFGTINHDILLHKLDHYGIRGLPKKWFQSFVSGRSQYTSIKIRVQINYLLHMVFHKDQCLVPYSSYSTSTILTKLLYIAMHTTLQMIQIYSTAINL